MLAHDCFPPGEPHIDGEPGDLIFTIRQQKLEYVHFTSKTV